MTQVILLQPRGDPAIQTRRGGKTAIVRDQRGRGVLRDHEARVSAVVRGEKGG